MKKKDAQDLAIIRSNLISEYITQILSDSNKVNAKMDFDFVKVDSEKMCFLNIYVPETKFEKHLNLGIPNYTFMAFLEKMKEQVLNDLLHFLPSDTIGVSKYMEIKSSLLSSFSGVVVSNATGSKIKINFGYVDKNIVTNYMNKYNEFLKKLNSEEKLRK